jgi:hypothetical protein
MVSPSDTCERPEPEHPMIFCHVNLTRQAPCSALPPLCDEDGHLWQYLRGPCTGSTITIAEGIQMGNTPLSLDIHFTLSPCLRQRDRHAISVVHSSLSFTNGQQHLRPQPYHDHSSRKGVPRVDLQHTVENAHVQQSCHGQCASQQEKPWAEPF